jgi:hypothetical protein
LTPSQQIDIAEKNLARLLDWISRTDSKSSLVLGVDMAMLGVLASLAPPLKNLSLFLTIISGAATGFLIGSLVCIYNVNYPRTKGPLKSLIYFGAIAGQTFNEYQQAFAKRSEAEYLNDLLEQCHRNSEIITLKFKALKWAYRSLLIAVPLWMAALYYFKFVLVKPTC